MFWFLLLFPLMIYPWGYDPYYTTIKTDYLYLFVIGTWVYIIFKRKYYSLIPEKNNRTILYILIAFLSLIEISTAFSKYNYTAVYGTIDRCEGLITFFCYISVFLFCNRLLDTRKITKLLSGMAVVSLIVSLYGILQHYSLDFLPRNSAMRHYSGTYTFFDNPNFFGSYLVLVLLLSMTLYITIHDKNLTKLYYISVSLSFISMLFSNTRSAYLGVFSGMVFLTVFVIFKRKNLWRKWAVLLITLILLAVGINTLEKNHYSFRAYSIISDSYKVVTNQSNGHEGSSRYFIWKKSLPLVKEYFWIGSGPDTFEFIFPATPKERKEFLGNPNTVVDKAHNEYLQIAITLGIPALLTYLLFLIFVIRKAIRAVQIVEGDDKIILYGLLSTVLGYLIQAFFNISTVPVAPMFWGILGITLAKADSILKNKLGLNSSRETMEKYKSA
ncbi:O-antigen ligase family protein [Bacillus sp. FJAT-29953]|nr:O-antigen ligase family protein [Bacillus sp. FJAT-29953]